MFVLLNECPALLQSLSFSPYLLSQVTHSSTLTLQTPEAADGRYIHMENSIYRTLGELIMSTASLS